MGLSRLKLKRLEVLKKNMESGKIFINFSDKDRDIAVKLCNVLESSGLLCWISCRDIPAGANYKDKIIEALSTCRLMILLISETSCNSKYVIREVDLAFDNDVPIIPIRIHDVKPSGKMKYSISPVNWIDAYEKPLADYYHLIISEVKAFGRNNDYEKPPDPPPPEELPEWMSTGEDKVSGQTLYVIRNPIKCLKSVPGSLPHVVILLCLVTLFMIFEVFQLRLAFPDKNVGENLVIFNMTIAILIIPFCLLVCFFLPFILLPFKKRSSWTISIIILFLAFSLEGLLNYQICYKGTLDFSSYPDWPVPLIVAKDSWSFFAFATALVTNTWNHILAILAQKYEQKNVRNNRNSMVLPTIIIQIPLLAYMLIIGFLIVILMIWDFLVQASTLNTFPGTQYFITFGLLRNTIAICIALEVFVWHYNQLKRR